MLPATYLTAVPHYLCIYIPAIFQRDNLHPGGGWVWRECGLPVAHLRPVHHRDDDKVTSAANRSIGSTTGCTITEKAPTRAFSWLKAPTSAFTFKTLC